MSAATAKRLKRRSRGSDTLLEAANRILRLLGVNAKAVNKPVKPMIHPRPASPPRPAPMPQPETPVNPPIIREVLTNPATLVQSNMDESKAQRVMSARRTSKDFVFGKAIGEGCFSTVYLARDIHTGKEYAIKVCEKAHIKKEDKVKYVIREKDALNMMSNEPGFVRLYSTFHDDDMLYFVLSYAKNGELLQHIKRVGSFELNVARHYAAELLLALERMHAKEIIHRDLKPENILLDENMHLQITDFGTTKIISKTDEPTSPSPTNGTAAATSTERQRKKSFVGTAQYVSPELLTHKDDSKASDLWAFGCIIYQMISGLPPFRAPNDYLIFKKILNLDYDFPRGFSAEAKDLVQKLLVLEASDRLGAADEGDQYTSIRNHPFFDGIDWDNVWNSTPPSIAPYLLELDNEFYRIPDDREPGLDKISIEDIWHGGQVISKGILNITPEEKKIRLEKQKESNKWHKFVEGELILKQGLVDKRKGLFPRRRMLLLTTGPRLFYVDPVTMTLKGEIPWSPQLRVERKNFQIFFVHTPNRTYYLEDPESGANRWCDAIDEVRHGTYGRDTT